MDKYLYIIKGASKEQSIKFLKIKEPYVKQAWLRYIEKHQEEINGRYFKDPYY